MSFSSIDEIFWAVTHKRADFDVFLLHFKKWQERFFGDFLLFPHIKRAKEKVFRCYHFHVCDNFRKYAPLHYFVSSRVKCNFPSHTHSVCTTLAVVNLFEIFCRFKECHSLEWSSSRAEITFHLAHFTRAGNSSFSSEKAHKFYSVFIWLEKLKTCCSEPRFDKLSFSSSLLLHH